MCKDTARVTRILNKKLQVNVSFIPTLNDIERHITHRASCQLYGFGTLVFNNHFMVAMVAMTVIIIRLMHV